MIERICDWCGRTIRDDVTVKDESPAAFKYQPEPSGDIPWLCVECSTKTKNR